MENTLDEPTDNMNNDSNSFDFDHLQARAEDYVRESPSKAAVIAFVTGFIFAMLPIGGIIGALIRLVLFLVRPALMVFGVVKVYEEIQKASDQ